MKLDFTIIAFDADDTLWVNEPFYQETEENFSALLSEFAEKSVVSEELFSAEMRNLELYGYGAKGFVLSMIETALQISGNRIRQETIGKIIDLGKELIDYPLHLIDGVKPVLDLLSEKEYTLIIVTKGDLLDQERKLKKSDIGKYFRHIEIVSDKKESDYKNLLTSFGIEPEEFLMIGNSLRSDIIPVLNIGGYGIHIPFHAVWQYEDVVSEKLPDERFLEIDRIAGLIDIFSSV